jgi:hypothetical protein
MPGPESEGRDPIAAVAPAASETPAFEAGDAVRVDDRAPVGHYRVPTYLRGQAGVVRSVITPAAVDNEEEGFGRNAGERRHYYRVAFPMIEVWPGYQGSPRDELLIEVFESWLEEA